MGEFYSMSEKKWNTIGLLLILLLLSHSNIDTTYVVFNMMSFAGKPLFKISFGPLQSYF